MATLYEELCKKADAGASYSDERKLVRELCAVIEKQDERIVALETDYAFLKATIRKLDNENAGRRPLR